MLLLLLQSMLANIFSAFFITIRLDPTVQTFHFKSCKLFFCGFLKLMITYYVSQENLHIRIVFYVCNLWL